MQAYDRLKPIWTRWCASIRFSHIPFLQIELELFLVASQSRYCLMHQIQPHDCMYVQLWVCQG